MLFTFVNLTLVARAEAPMGPVSPPSSPPPTISGPTNSAAGDMGGSDASERSAPMIDQTAPGSAAANGPAAGVSASAVPQTIAVELPPDLDQLLKRIQVCSAVWEKEPMVGRRPRPGESERLEKFQQSLKKNKCSNLSRSLIEMREKYKTQPEVVKICDGLITQPPDQYKALLKGP